ncbi:MAG: hypothetical protein KDG89_15075 [Geminicoccaceae bacterium]|nr:hypothetical protein [Geminicoccaceae bacterium]
MTQGFLAILLVCLADVPHAKCDETTATEVRSTVVDNEIQCVVGWQEMVSGARVDGQVYLKTVCRRYKPK